jgi:WD40 repeat protein
MRANLNSSHKLHVGFGLALLLAVTGLQSSGVANDAPKEVNVALYRTGNREDHNLYALDARTLADLSAEPAAKINREFEPGIINSRDGSTIAGLGSDHDIQIQDGLTGKPRNQFSPGGEVWPLALNADGSKLVVSVVNEYSPNGLLAPAWRVFDTATGDLTCTIQSEPESGNDLITVVDPVAWKLYRLMPSVPSEVESDKPQLAKLKAIDLKTGADIGQVELPGVLMGFWFERESIEEPTVDQPPNKYLIPGLALSPDGLQIAVAHADEDKVTLVDNAKLKVERTVTVKPKASLLDQVLASLPFAPRVASAKSATAGVRISATYSADASYLYVGGSETAFVPGPTGNFQTGRGLTVVNLNDGTIEAHALPNFEVSQIYPLPNGKIYLTGIDWYEASPNLSPYVIALMDSQSLNRLATRRFPIFVWFYVTPAD